MPKYKNNILLISFEMTYTGSPRALYNLARLLLDCGKKVTVFTLNSGPFEKEFQNLNIEVKNVTADEIINNSELKNDYELVVCNTIFCIDIAYAIQNEVNTVLYIMEANNIRELVRNCNLSFEKLSQIKNIFCVSEYAKQAILNLLKTDNVYVLHNYIEKYKKSTKKNSFRKIRFVVSGTVEYRKAQEIAIKAFNSLESRFRCKCELHIIGNTPEWSKDYRKQLEKIADCEVFFHDVINETERLYDFYKQMDVFLIPSRDESCSLVALEASMLKKTIIVTENVGAKYLLENNKKNIIPVNDYKCLCNRMVDYIKKPWKIYIDGFKGYISYSKYGTYKFVRKEILRIMRDFV